DARRTSHAEPFSLDAGAPEITSIAVERCRARCDIPCCSEEDMAVAVDTNSCLSSDLISIRSNPKPIGRTDQLPETGAAAIEPGVDADGAGPPAESAVPIRPRVYPGL